MQSDSETGQARVMLQRERKKEKSTNELFGRIHGKFRLMEQIFHIENVMSIYRYAVGSKEDDSKEKKRV